MQALTLSVSSSNRDRILVCMCVLPFAVDPVVSGLAKRIGVQASCGCFTVTAARNTLRHRDEHHACTRGSGVAPPRRGHALLTYSLALAIYRAASTFEYFSIVRWMPNSVLQSSSFGDLTCSAFRRLSSIVFDLFSKSFWRMDNSVAVYNVHPDVGGELGPTGSVSGTRSPV